MNTQNNGPPLTGIVDITANSISLFQDKNVDDIFIHKSDISVAEPYDVPIDENGNVVQMCKFIGDVNDTKVAGLEPLLNYMNGNFFSKDEPSVHEHHYNITKKQYCLETNKIYNVDKNKTFNIKNHRCTDGYYYNKKQ